MLFRSVSGNVVPDTVVLTINHRFAPDRSIAEAETHIRHLLGEALLGDSAALVVVDVAGGAEPSLTHPLLARLAALVGEAPTAKLGWTDVAFFAAQGIPAVNFGPGDPTIAHTKNELVHRHEIEAAARILTELVS